MAWAADLSMGIGIIKDRNTELLLGEQNYELILKKAYDAFDRAFLPVLIVDSEYIHDDALQFLDAVVFVSTSAIDECIKEPLRQFKENGGIVAATYNLAMFDVEGNSQDNSWVGEFFSMSSPVVDDKNYQALLELDGEKTTLSFETTLVKPINFPQTTGSLIDTEYSSFIKTDNTLYCSLNLFSVETTEKEQVFEDFFVSELYSLMDKDYYGLITLEYEEIKPLASETRNLLRVGQREYRKSQRIQALTPEVEELYEESLLLSKALQFAVETRSAYHLPIYVPLGNKIATELYEKTSPTKIPYEIIQARGSYWANKVELYSTEEIPDNPIVFIGDSLTDRYDLSKYYPDLPVINRGVGGDFATGLWDRKHLLGLEKDPQAIFVMIGTNNFIYNNQLFSYLSDVEKFLLYLKENAPNSRIFLHSICPMAKSVNVSPQTIQETNKELEKLAQNNNITYIDLYSLFADENGYIRSELTVDGVHFTPLGYKIWTDKVKELL